MPDDPVYFALWQAIVARIDALPSGMSVRREDLQRWLIEIWNEQPEPAQAVAVRTTEYGGDPRHG